LNSYRRAAVGLIGFAVAISARAMAIAAPEPHGLSERGQTNGYLDADGAKIYYEERGAGPAIVLLHDGLLDAATWDEVWKPLAISHEVIRYDRRGYGRSEPATSSFSPIEDLTKLLRHLKVEHAVIVGSSSGGALAIDFTIAHPEMVDGLILIGPVLPGMEFSAEFRERAKRNNEPMDREDAQAMARNWAQDKFLIAGTNDKARRKIYDELIANAEKLRVTILASKRNCLRQQANGSLRSKRRRFS
jgi:3-oxoadipate enol-lactonase